VGQCTEQATQIVYPGTQYLPEGHLLRKPLTQVHHDTLTAGHQGRVEIFDILDLGVVLERYVETCRLVSTE